jgi:hypothetical protein
MACAPVMTMRLSRDKVAYNIKMFFYGIKKITFKDVRFEIFIKLMRTNYIFFW